MKFALALLALVAMAFTKTEAACNSGALNKEIQDFLILLPIDDIVDTTVRYMAEDAEFQDMIVYMQTEKFKNLVVKVEGMEAVKDLIKYICNAGFDIISVVNAFNEWLGLPSISEKLSRNNFKTGGIRGYLDEIEALLPLDKMQALYDKKMKESKVWKEFIGQLQSKEFQDIVNKVYVEPVVQELIERARQHGMDLKKVVELMEAFLGIKIPPKPY